VEDGWRESSRTPRRVPARRRARAAERAGQSRSASRLIAAPHVTRHPDAITLDAAVELAAVLVLLEEGLECVEEGHAASVEHALLDDLVRPPQHRRRNRKAERLGGLEIDHQLQLRRLFDR
jgi:hypothetical protein